MVILSVKRVERIEAFTIQEVLHERQHFAERALAIHEAFGRDVEDMTDGSRLTGVHELFDAAQIDGFFSEEQLVETLDVDLDVAFSPGGVEASRRGLPASTARRVGRAFAIFFASAVASCGR
jgi:hypothetical protein